MMLTCYFLPFFFRFAGWIFAPRFDGRSVGCWLAAFQRFASD
jgi:hypothetical protein